MTTVSTKFSCLLSMSFEFSDSKNTRFFSLLRCISRVFSRRKSFSLFPNSYSTEVVSKSQRIELLWVKYWDIKRVSPQNYIFWTFTAAHYVNIANMKFKDVFEFQSCVRNLGMAFSFKTYLILMLLSKGRCSCIQEIVFLRSAIVIMHAVSVMTTYMFDQHQSSLGAGMCSWLGKEILHLLQAQTDSIDFLKHAFSPILELFCSINQSNE